MKLDFSLDIPGYNKLEALLMLALLIFLVTPVAFVALSLEVGIKDAWRTMSEH